MKDYTREIFGITGQEPPLTPADIRTAVRWAFDGCRRGERLLTDPIEFGREQRHWSGGQPRDGSIPISVSCSEHRGGLLIRITDFTSGQRVVRVGRISWRTAADVLRQLREPASDALFDLAAVGARPRGGEA